MADAPQGEHRLIVAGSGGQGVLTFCKLLSMAAVREGHSVTYLPSYGPEVRSGTARCRVVISSGEIYSPLVEEADSLVIFNGESYQVFHGLLRPDGLLAVNSSAVEAAEVRQPGQRLLALPVTDLAADLGEVKVANVIMLGAYVRAGGLVSEGHCRDALAELLGTRKAALLDLNLRALARGFELAAGGR